MKAPESVADTLAPELRREADLRELRRLQAKYPEHAAQTDLIEAAKWAVMEWRLHGQLTDSCRQLEKALGIPHA